MLDRCPPQPQPITSASASASAYTFTITFTTTRERGRDGGARLLTSKARLAVSMCVSIYCAVLLYIELWILRPSAELLGPGQENPSPPQKKRLLWSTAGFDCAFIFLLLPWWIFLFFLREGGGEEGRKKVSCVQMNRVVEGGEVLWVCVESWSFWIYL